jgi:hypothetical protein
MRAKIIKKLPAASNFFEAARVYVNSMNTLSTKLEMKRMMSLLSYLFWPLSPKKLQPIKVVAPSSLSRDNNR